MLNVKLLKSLVRILSTLTFSNSHKCNEQALLTLSHALLTSKLDYCNAFYMDLPLNITQKFQLAQNAVMWVVRCTPGRAHLMYMLHVCSLLLCPIQCVVFQALKSFMALALRSAYPFKAGRKSILQAKSAMDLHLHFKKCAFSAKAPTLWNFISSPPST